MKKMKKAYIIPAVKNIQLDLEALVALSGGELSNTEKGGGSTMSNQRDASSSIWGEEY